MPIESNAPNTRPEDAPPPTNNGDTEHPEYTQPLEHTERSSNSLSLSNSDELENLATPPPRTRRIASASQSYGLRNDAQETPTRTTSDEDANQALNNSTVDADTVAVARGELGGNLGPYAVRAE